jgi:hypothetical protein
VLTEAGFKIAPSTYYAALTQVLLNFPSERHWIRYARKNLRQPGSFTGMAGVASG